MLAHLVDLMITLGLTFEQEKTEDGQPMMRLEPAIDVFVHYDGKRAADVAAGRFAVRQLVSQSVSLQCSLCPCSMGCVPWAWSCAPSRSGVVRQTQPPA